MPGSLGLSDDGRPLGADLDLEAGQLLGGLGSWGDGEQREGGSEEEGGDEAGHGLR